MHVELRDIHKHFGPVHANAGISLTVGGGTIHGLLGENGAGKSTLMKILSGFQAPDSGAIALDGRPVRIGSPAQAIALGIGMLHQDPLDFPPLSVLENFLLGRDARLVPAAAAARRELAELAARFGFDLPPDLPVAALSVGERQQLEIVRLLALGVRALILDEPTTGISAPQKVKLFEALRRLAAAGHTVLFVTHKLEDAEELCGEVTVLREGRHVATRTMPVPPGELVRLMFGQALPQPEREPVQPGAPVLELRGLALSDGRLQLRDIDFVVRAGEAIGLAGLEGSGQRSFLRACAGLARLAAGEVRIAGERHNGRPYRRYLASGVTYLPAGRLEEGLVPGLTLAEHFLLAGPAGGFFIDWERARERAAERIRAHHIIGRPDTPVEALSGGNQQRALLALLPEQLRLLLVEHPTRGLDIESSLWIWDQLRARRRRGLGLIFSSSDLDELLANSDRILVFFGGRIIAEVPATGTDANQLGYLIAGKQAP
jgi:simple sugar transport system ATP-binding protein